MHSRIRKLVFAFRPQVITNTAGDVETAALRFTPLGINWESGDRLNFFVNRETENLDSSFEISDGVTIPQDDYDHTRYGFSFKTSNKRTLSADFSTGFGGFYGGDRENYEVELDWRPSKHALFGAEYEIDRVHLPGGDFDVNLARLRADFLFSPKLSWTNFVQWDDVNDSIGVNSRLWKIFEPGREAFFVVNQGWDMTGDHIVPIKTSVLMKLGYTFRF